MHKNRFSQNISTLGLLAKCLYPLTTIAFAIFAGTFSHAATDIMQRGPFVVHSAEYQLPAKVDPEILDGVKTELWAKTYWPEPPNVSPSFSVPRPILFFLHGNHGTCGQGSAPRDDYGCEYTFSGQCPKNSVVVPNHLGYQYAAEQLASWGFVVVSINANLGITCGDGPDGDDGLIIARGRLVLKHIEKWIEWNSRGGAPKTLGPENQWIRRIDFSNVGLMGHSRGGEGMRAAYNLAISPKNSWKSRLPGLQIKGVFEIGSVDGMSSKVFDANGTSWVQLLPLCDGDVRSLEGRLPFERMLNAKDEANGHPKTLFEVWGANHNFFNTEWQVNDSLGCFQHDPIFKPSLFFSIEQQQVASAAMTAFFKAHLGPDAEPDLDQVFDPLFSLPGPIAQITNVHRDYSILTSDSGNLRLERFLDNKHIGRSGEKFLESNVNVEISEYTQPTFASVSWQKTNNPINHLFEIHWASPNRPQDLSSYSTLDFRVGPQVIQPIVQNPIDFTVTLSDSSGRRSAPLEIRKYVSLIHALHPSASLFQTARIPLANVVGIDLSKTIGIQFNFNHSESGQIQIADIRATSFLVAPNLSDFSQGSQTPSASTRPKVRSFFEGPDSEVMNQLSQIVSRANLVQIRLIEGKNLSETLDTEREQNLEVIVATEHGFPIMDALPVLRWGPVRFTHSRFVQTTKGMQLAFRLTREQYQSLDPNAELSVQYGKEFAWRVWRVFK